MDHVWRQVESKTEWVCDVCKIYVKSAVGPSGTEHRYVRLNTCPTCGHDTQWVPFSETDNRCQGR